MVVGNAYTMRPEIAMAAMMSCLCAITVPTIDLDIGKYMVLNYLKSSSEEVPSHFISKKGNSMGEGRQLQICYCIPGSGIRE